MTKTSGEHMPVEDRLTSLDFFRGFTMFLLIGEATGLYAHLRAPQLSGTVLGAIGWQLEHHPWNGLHFWDLIQPFFMFIVGVAMPFSIGKRWERGDSWSKTFRHALARSGSAAALWMGPLLHRPRTTDFRALERAGAAFLYLPRRLPLDAPAGAGADRRSPSCY